VIAVRQTALAEVLTVLAEVLTGRDRVPEWRGDRTRRTAMLAGWAVALLLVGPVVALTFAGRFGHAASLASWQPGGLGWLAVALVVAAALPLAPRFALLAWRVAFLGALISPLIPGQSRADGGIYAVLAITLAVAGLRYGPRHLWWMIGLSLIPVWLWTGPDWVYPAVNTAWLAVLGVVVQGAAYWRRDRRELLTQTEHATREREMAARSRELAARSRELAARERERAEQERARAEQEGERNAVLEERARIAREMHDVVAHHMSMIAVQAETAPYRLAARGTETPAPVAAEFTALSAAAREALTDMRRLLGVLRSDTTVPVPSTSIPSDNSKKPEADLAPQPRLEDIPELVETARRAGAKVTLAMPSSPPGPVSSGAGLAAYRIVQESLSNAARHAPGAEVTVTVGQSDGSLRLTVANEPPAAPRPAGNGNGDGDGDGPPGHGLTGMRERAALLGGTLEAGPGDDGGFTVRARLPMGSTT
jgi:signal transduction histidine kinase